MSDMQNLITRVFEHAAGRPMWEVMRADEEAAGNRVIVPGDVPWLPESDWHPTIIVSQSGKEVRLIAILANEPGKGAFRRLVGGIISAGLVPVIIAPTRPMRDTMKRWNWAPRQVGRGWNHEEQWRPRKGWKAMTPSKPDPLLVAECMAENRNRLLGTATGISLIIERDGIDLGSKTDVKRTME